MQTNVYLLASKQLCNSNGHILFIWNWFEGDFVKLSNYFKNTIQLPDVTSKSEKSWISTVLFYMQTVLHREDCIDLQSTISAKSDVWLAYCFHLFPLVHQTSIFMTSSRRTFDTCNGILPSFPLLAPTGFFMRSILFIWNQFNSLCFWCFIPIYIYSVENITDQLHWHLYD